MRSRVGIVPQKPYLFSGTIASNLQYGKDDATEEEMWEALRVAQAEDFVRAMPGGLNAVIAQGGTNVSGGQRQRVGLARALYGKPVFVVLDEPNSSLDEAGDAALANAVATLKQQGTTFVVMTHRTSILGVADKMLIMRDGAQQAFGPRDEVLAALQKARQPGQQQPQVNQAIPAN